MMEDSNLSLLKDIPGFKAIVRAVLKSQMKHLVEQLSEHGGEEAMLFTASVSDGTFHHLGSTATKGFLDSRDNLKSQFLGHCMKGTQDIEVPNVNAESVVETSSDKASPQTVTTTTHSVRSVTLPSSDKVSPNTVANTTRSGRSVTLPLKYISSPVAQKGVGETVTNALQTSSSKAGSKVSSPKKGRGKKSRKRPSATVTSETPLKRSAIAETVTQALNVLSSKTGLDQEDVGESVKIENNFNDQDTTQMEESDSSGTLSLDLGLEPSLDTEIKDRPDKVSESNELEHQGQDLKIKIEPVDNESADFEESTDKLDVGFNSEMVGHGGDTTATEPGPNADANTKMDLPPLDGNTMNISLMVSTKKEPEDTMTIETPRLFKCGVCHYQTRRRFNHQRHMQTHSEMSKEFLCHICGKKFKSEKGLNLHRLNHQGISKFRCNVCKKGFNVNAPFQAHLKMHIVSKSFKCKTCGVKYAHLKDLRNHQRNIHLGIIFSCSLCELTFAKKDTLTDHNQTVHQGRRYVCHKCNKLFKYRSSLAYHRKKNHPDDTV